MAPLNLHATTVAHWTHRGWRAVLLIGESGAGKSDLALRLLDRRWRLVADDRTILWRSGGRLFVRAPDTIAGLMEARGLGILVVDTLPLAEAALAVRCEPAPERLPEPEAITLLGANLPLLRLSPFEPSTAGKLERALASRA